MISAGSPVTCLLAATWSECPIMRSTLFKSVLLGCQLVGCSANEAQQASGASGGPSSVGGVANGQSGSLASSGTHAAGSSGSSGGGVDAGGGTLGGAGLGGAGLGGGAASGLSGTGGALAGAGAQATGGQAGGGTNSAGTRDKLKQPFASDSIWNMPIGSNATYVPGNIVHADQWGMTTDQDVIVMSPGSPLVDVYYSDAGWSGTSRCAATGAKLYSLPIPSDFIVRGGGAGDTPNFAAAVLDTDGRTLRQPQPLAHCSAGGIATTLVTYPASDIYGPGIDGAHGGSGLSSIGGTLRLGELVSGGPPIRHVLKINLYEQLNISNAGSGYRWPATKADSCYPGCYGGSVFALKMGALLALPSTINLDNWALKTGPGKMLAWTLQNYGAYLVDSTGWNVYAIETEFGPGGAVDDEFKASWGFDIGPQSGSDPWAQDMDKIFRALAVVDNNAATSVGGGGTPRQPLAPPIGN